MTLDFGAMYKVNKIIFYVHDNPVALSEICHRIISFVSDFFNNNFDIFVSTERNMCRNRENFVESIAIARRVHHDQLK
ncbi:hypothetical protein Ciccas_012705 [Cichlidogyrus casuarinus]|uniref:Uncharacterized protein n=1 Tax=Cichlidogyrus casuarinus TaxID=1844966 RepID=A0ABD2PMN0_9PLAT